MLKFGRQNVPDTSDAGGRGARSGARSTDPTEDLKRRARQRLIGAVILVLTAIIVVPMLLDSEPRPLGQDIAITIPPKDAPFNGQAPANAANSVPAAGTPAAPATAAGAAAVAPAVPPTSSSAAASPPAADAVKPAQPAPETTAAPAAVKPVEAAKPETTKAEAAKPAAKPESAKPEAAKPAAKDDGDKARALLEGKPLAKPAADGKYIVQVGAFASEEKVKELQARLKSAGLSTYTEKVKTGAGERIRLRAGPFGARADAEGVLGKIKAAGISGAVIVQ